MPVSQVCINARATLAEIYSLKDAFDLALQQAIECGSTQDIVVCERLKQELTKKTEELNLDLRFNARDELIYNDF